MVGMVVHIVVHIVLRIVLLIVVHIVVRMVVRMVVHMVVYMMVLIVFEPQICVFHTMFAVRLLYLMFSKIIHIITTEHDWYCHPSYKYVWSWR